jgi:hypothetical protein
VRMSQALIHQRPDEGMRDGTGAVAAPTGPSGPVRALPPER